MQVTPYVGDTSDDSDDYSRPSASRHQRTFFLDEPATLQPGTAVPSQPRFTTMRRVCANFFTFAFGVSLNFVYQKHGDVEMHVNREPRHPHQKGPSKADHVIIWMLNFASIYEISPDSPFVILPMSRIKDVYEIFKVDSDQSNEELPKASVGLVKCVAVLFRVRSLCPTFAAYGAGTSGLGTSSCASICVSRSVMSVSVFAKPGQPPDYVCVAMSVCLNIITCAQQ